MSKRALTAVLIVVILAIAGAFGIYYTRTSAALSAQGQSISALESTVSSLASHPVTSTATSVSTQTETTTSVSTTRSVIAITTTQFPGMPWSSAIFMTSLDGACNEICLGTSLSSAIVFICPSPIATATESCPVTFYSTTGEENMSIVVTYPEYNQTNELPVDNCEYDAHWLPSDTLVAAGQGYGYCLQVGSNALVVAQQAPGPA